MRTNVIDRINRFANLSVVVLGDAMLDSYLSGSSQRLCQEAPVPIVDLSSRVDAPGGGANTAANAAALGARTALVSAVGDDPDGAALLRLLEAGGVSTEYIRRAPDRRTLSKRRVSAGGHLVVRIDDGSTNRIPYDVETALDRALPDAFHAADAVIVSDYGYGVMTGRLIRAVHRLQNRSPRVLAVDAKVLAAYRDASVTVMKPNYDEAVRLMDVAPFESTDARVSQITQHAADLLSITGAQIVAVTLGHDGALVLEQGAPCYRTYAHALPNARSAGAGDTFLAAFALSLATGAPAPAAAEVASAASSIVARKPFTAVCAAAELRARFTVRTKQVAGVQALAALAAGYRQRRRRIVFTNGCFDLLHAGHAAYLNGAKALGDVLIVAVNGDAGVRRLKGEGRPINPLEDRLHVLSALSCIDHLVAFDDDTPHALIRAVAPDIYVKGGDYTRDRLPEAALVESLGGTVTILPYVNDRSTTGLIERIRVSGPRAHVQESEASPHASGSLEAG